MRVSFFVFIFSSIAFVGNAQSPKEKDLAAFIQLKGDSFYKAAKLPGLFVAVFDGSEQVFNFGYAVPDEKLPFDASTIFEAGSITKTCTAFILESILKAKKIDDTTSINAYLPDSVRANKALASISFLSLMNHTSGLPRLPDNLNLNSKNPYDNYTLADLFRYLKTCVPKTDGKFNYSNLGMGLAGVLAQRIAGKDYSTLLRQYVLRPFDMGDATATKQHKAQGYFGDDKQTFWNMAALAPAGSLQCSATDMLHYLQALSLGGSSSQKATIEKLLTPTAVAGPAVHICRAWHTFEQGAKPTIYWHDGGTYGFSTFAAFVKNTERCVIVVANKFNTNMVTDTFGLAILNKMLE